MLPTQQLLSIGNATIIMHRSKISMTCLQYFIIFICDLLYFPSDVTATFKLKFNSLLLLCHCSLTRVPILPYCVIRTKYLSPKFEQTKSVDMSLILHDT